MQALHRKLYVVLVRIMLYNCSETDYSFCEDSPPAGLRLLPGCGFQPQTPLVPPTIFFVPPPLAVTLTLVCRDTRIRWRHKSMMTSSMTSSSSSVLWRDCEHWGRSVVLSTSVDDDDDWVVRSSRSRINCPLGGFHSTTCSDWPILSTHTQTHRQAGRRLGSRAPAVKV